MSVCLKLTIIPDMNIKTEQQNNMSKLIYIIYIQNKILYLGKDLKQKRTFVRKCNLLLYEMQFVIVRNAIC